MIAALDRDVKRRASGRVKPAQITRPSGFFASRHGQVRRLGTNVSGTLMSGVTRVTQPWCQTYLVSRWVWS